MKYLQLRKADKFTSVVVSIMGLLLTASFALAECREGGGRRRWRFPPRHAAFGQDVTVYREKRDRYGRRLAEMLLSDDCSLNQELIKAGLAWWFRKYSKYLRLGEMERGDEIQTGVMDRAAPGSTVGMEVHQADEMLILFGNLGIVLWTLL